MSVHTQHRDAIIRLLSRADQLELSPKARQKLKWFEFSAMHGGNISLACRHFGIARTTFMRWFERFDPSDETTLEEESRRPHHVRTSEISKDVIEMISELRRQQPFISKEDVSATLGKKNISISPSTVGRIITRHGLFFGDTPLHRRKRAESEDGAASPFLRFARA